MTANGANPSAHDGDRDPETDRPSARPTLRYQPALDGIRFFGIISVMCGHLTPVQPVLAPLSSFMFVDMFFVSSGYLITTLLLRELSANGHVNLKAFYVRRFARIYPLIGAIIVITLAQHIVTPNSDNTPSWLAIAGIAAYFANFVQIYGTSFPLGSWGPLWSLSIEEQFYAIWPITLLLIMGRKFRIRGALITIGCLTVIMWAWRTYSWQSDPSHGHMDYLNVSRAWVVFYNSTFHRPDGLLIGCALALILALPKSTWTRLLIDFAHRFRFLVIAGIVLIAIKTTYGYGDWQIWFGLGLFNILMALLIIEFLHHPESLPTRFFGFRPFAWVGRRTYFIYALHHLPHLYGHHSRAHFSAMDHRLNSCPLRVGWNLISFL